MVFLCFGWDAALGDDACVCTYNGLDDANADTLRRERGQDSLEFTARCVWKSLQYQHRLCNNSFGVSLQGEGWCPTMMAFAVLDAVAKDREVRISRSLE